MKIYAVIPARYGSSRFPGKPLAIIAGRPMIQHVYQCAAACPEISQVFVATDDERILQTVHDFGGKAVMTEKAHQSGTDRIAEAVRTMDLEDNDLIVNIQGDQPLFETDVISKMIAPLIGDTDISMGTLKYRIIDEKDIANPNIVKVVTDKEGFAIYFSRSTIPCYRETDTKPVYFKHLGLYVYRKAFLMKFSALPCGILESAEKLEQLRAIENGFKIKVVETMTNSLEVDTPEDVKKIEKAMAEA
jgi:3-deoxy-manno-octulosonate cytidylyltransferase (CMP-KDO synthetase)